MKNLKNLLKKKPNPWISLIVEIISTSFSIVFLFLQIKILSQQIVIERNQLQIYKYENLPNISFYCKNEQNLTFFPDGRYNENMYIKYDDKVIKEPKIDTAILISIDITHKKNDYWYNNHYQYKLLNYYSLNISFSKSDSLIRLGNSNLDTINNIREKTSILRNLENFADISLLRYVKISYKDFQNEEHTEYYLVGPGLSSIKQNATDISIFFDDSNNEIQNIYFSDLDNVVMKLLNN